MFNQLKHQLELDNPNPPDPETPQQVNSMPWDGTYQKNSRWTSDKVFNNPPKQAPIYSRTPPFVKYRTPEREYV